MSRRGCRSMVLAFIALAACPALAAAAAAPTFRPRIGGALGIIPAAGSQEIALGSDVPVVYHGGSVMRNVTVHTIFWAPSGFSFDGPPPGSLGYEPLLQRFFADVAHDSGLSTNAFSVLPQFGDAGGPGQSGIQYTPAADSIDDTNPYPGAGDQCASPFGVRTCVTDLQLQHEIDSVIQSRAPGARGLSHIWFIFLPPNVDTCTSPGACGTNAYAGYHGQSNLGHGDTVYAVVPDPLIEGTPAQGGDPQGNPEGEFSIDTAAHETVEVITDPMGVGWMDPNGSEVGDKCDLGPQTGTELGYATNGSPYSQLINGHQYLFQGMWSNSPLGCVQLSTTTTSPLPLAQVYLTQFSSVVSGATGIAKPGVHVSIHLLRTGVEVASATATTAADGRWGPATLKSGSGRGRHAVGDDRDEIDVSYGHGGPRGETILTGDGGNPFAQSGWTGWFDLDNGFGVASSGNRGVIALAPCSQTGVFALRVDNVLLPSPNDTCETETDLSIVHTHEIGAASSISVSNNDNRAVFPSNPNGALVRLRVQLGESNSVSALGNALIPIQPTGFPSCTGDLGAGRVSCTGLVPGARYALIRLRGTSPVHATANGNGSIAAGGFRGAAGLYGGDAVVLANHAGRTLTVLHLAHLKVNITGSQTVIASGVCEPGDYYGSPLSAPPVIDAVGAPGVAGTGTICPLNGDATGLPADSISQTDDLSGGQTKTEVATIEDTSPGQDATVYGRFVAVATAGFPGPNGSIVPSHARIAVTITRSTNRRIVFRAANVNTGPGVRVRALPSGAYAAKWVLTDANGDTRTVRSRFFEQ